jgi:hypothetical protein
MTISDTQYNNVVLQINPAANVTNVDAIADFRKLRAGNCTRCGSLLTDKFFFKHRLAVIRPVGVLRGRGTFREYLERGMKNACEKQMYAHKRAEGESKYYALYRTYCMYYKSVNQFPPSIARGLYRKFRPECVLDFCAGWGGRLAGAMALDIDYIGCESNTDLRPAYRDMIQLLKPESKSKVTIKFGDSSRMDFSNLKYDMVFTSPPYITGNRFMEVYRHMPSYADKQDFYRRFLHPVTLNAFTHLRHKGVLALNMNVDMYDDIVPVLGGSSMKIPLKLRRRSKESQYNEYIYIWRKP